MTQPLVGKQILIVEDEQVFSDQWLRHVLSPDWLYSIVAIACHY
ncbi:hypothetical protein PSZ75_23310 [Shigella sonnei]|nr:hypothetical protein [Shigella sonnei]